MAVGIALGHLPIGRWNKLGNEGIVTRFLVIGLPLVPLESFYVIGRHPRTWRAIPARWSRASVGIAYVRWVLAPLAFFGIVAVCATDRSAASPFEGPHAVAVVGALAVWAMLIFLTGRARGRAAAQRRVLSKYLGHAAPPEVLTEGAARLELDTLEDAWKQRMKRASPYRDPASAAPWREVFPKDVGERALPLYYALCRYEAAVTGDEVQGNRARIAWQLVEPRVRR